MTDYVVQGLHTLVRARLPVDEMLMVNDRIIQHLKSEGITKDNFDVLACLAVLPLVVGGKVGFADCETPEESVERILERATDHRIKHLLKNCST